MSRRTLALLSILCFFPLHLPAQQNQKAAPPASPITVPVAEAQKPNPVKATPESLARATARMVTAKARRPAK